MSRRLLGSLVLSLLAASVAAQERPLFDDMDEPIARIGTPVTRVATIPRQTIEPIPAPQIAPDRMTPELYLQLQELRRHDNPAQAVRRRAEAKAEQRFKRMESMKWFGMSNARPTASPVPYYGSYSPSWVGNGQDRNEWVGVGTPSATVIIQSDSVRR